MTPNAFKDHGVKVAQLKEELGVSRTTAHRIVTGEKFTKIGTLFRRIYEITNLTPNEILGIPPRKGR